MDEPTADMSSQPEFLIPPVRTDGSITLAEADPEWGTHFGRQEERIRAALGSRAVEVEHIGSTSVPGLAAKPVIDILLVVTDAADEAAYLPDLEAAGHLLQFREHNPTEHRFLTDTSHRPHIQVHVVTIGDPEVDRWLTFRDRLRTHPEDRDLYERTKRELAEHRWAYIQDYADAKSAVVQGIIARARADQQTRVDSSDLPHRHLPRWAATPKDQLS
jgi:GrpB-like predicted nucleotidyltransferase (UPF0157 family)